MSDMLAKLRNLKECRIVRDSKLINKLIILVIDTHEDKRLYVQHQGLAMYAFFLNERDGLVPFGLKMKNG